MAGGLLIRRRVWPKVFDRKIPRSPGAKHNLRNIN